MIHENFSHISAIGELDDMDNNSLVISFNISRYDESKGGILDRQGHHASPISTPRPNMFLESPLSISGLSMFLNQHGH